MGFVGRARELDALGAQLDVVRRGGRADRGVAVLVRGRRRVGKTRLASEFAARSGAPTVYFQAARGSAVSEELALFADAVATSGLPGAAIAQGNRPTTLTGALTLLAAALPDDAPSIVVLDEIPWLLEGFPGGAGELQRAWDTRLAGKPVLLLLLGSDLAMMERLTGPDQPFYARATEMVLGPLTPRDVGAMTASDAFTAFDAYLITGGLPLLAQEWEAGRSPTEFLASSFASPTSALVVSGARALEAEFGEFTRARQVLSAIGGRGERTFTGIQSAIGDQPLNASVLTDILGRLTDKRIVAVDEPLSTRAAHRDRRYRIADPALRFWLAFVEPALGEVDRGRPDLAAARVSAGFGSWRGRAVEPVVREALERLLPGPQWPSVRRVGGWWPRRNAPEIDLVGADARPATTVPFVGTVKWRAAKPITAAEVGRLESDATAVPGVTTSTALVAVCPAGAEPDPRLKAVWTAERLLEAWP